MEDPASLQPVFAGVYGVYSVQTPFSLWTRSGDQAGQACR